MAATTPFIVLYSKSPCVQCDAAKRKLNKAGLTAHHTTQAELDATAPEDLLPGYYVLDVAEDTRAREKVVALGYMQAPVLVLTDSHGQIHHRSGFVPDFVQQAIDAIQGVAA